MTEDLRALAAHAISSSRAASDPDYPVLHLAPPVGRLNDPNGLLIDDGVAHAFYQFTPLHGSDGELKRVFWGHASSTDLVHWTNHEPALAPDSPFDRDGVYSGGAVILSDAELSGLPTLTDRYQFFYTGNLKDPATGERTATQVPASSSDLVTLRKWPAGPVLSTPVAGYTAHFRDPQVTRDPRGGFRMLIGAQREDLTGALVLYRSEDLRHWTLEGEVSFPDAGGALDSFGFMWECPNLVTLTDESTGEDWDVLIWCPQGAHPTGPDGRAQEGFENVFPCVYAVGHLVGTEFRDCDGQVREVDRGFEFYAPQCFTRQPDQDGAIIMLGWAGNAGQDDQPSMASGGWVHCLTLPRRLALRDGRLRQLPILPDDDDEGADAYAERSVRTEGEEPARVAELDGQRTWRLTLRAGGGGEVGVRIGDADSHVDVRLSAGEEPVLTVDRSTSRYTQHGSVRTVTLPAGTQPQLDVVHDRSVTEVFVGRGDLAFTLRTYVEPTAHGAWVWATSPHTPARLGVRTLR